MGSKGCAESAGQRSKLTSQRAGGVQVSLTSICLNLTKLFYLGEDPHVSGTLD